MPIETISRTTRLLKYVFLGTRGKVISEMFYVTNIFEFSIIIHVNFNQIQIKHKIYTKWKSQRKNTKKTNIKCHCLQHNTLYESQGQRNSRNIKVLYNIFYLLSVCVCVCINFVSANRSATNHIQVLCDGKVKTRK